ncbi:MAG: SET domain-containing protein [Cyclobacteriaceae bacterium]|nr:SET domain-containing protein [Cyclobacteriaceae bacterium]
MNISRKHLFVRKSQLPDSGKGLFTKVEIKKGDRIIEYKGRHQLWREVKHEDGFNGYLLRLNRTMAINGEPSTGALGRYANDAAGASRIKGLRNNSVYNIYGDRCFIEATRDITKGGEVFVAYGKEYWDLVKKIKTLGLKRPRKR